MVCLYLIAEEDNMMKVILNQSAKAHIPFLLYFALPDVKSTFIRYISVLIVDKAEDAELPMFHPLI